MNYRDIEIILTPFKGRPLLLGFSGGADSLSLLLVLRQLRLPFAAIHFEHGFRGAESRAEAAYCEQLCRELEIPFRLLELRVPAEQLPGESSEAAARRCRLAAWQDLVEETPGAVILLAHQADDCRENLLLRLARGSNVSGLTGLRPVSRFANLTIVRPLLSTSRREIEQFLQQQGRTDWQRDSSNAENNYRRNFLRNRLLPELYRELPYAEAGLGRALAALEEDARYLEEQAERQLDLICEEPESEAAFWRKLPAALQIRVLRGYLSRYLRAEIIPDHALLRRFRELLTLPPAPEVRQLPLPGYGVWLLQNDRFRFQTVQNDFSLAWNWRSDAVILCNGYEFTAVEVAQIGDGNLLAADFDADQLPEQLRLEPARPGDRLVPFGRKTPEKLKKLRTDRKISALEIMPLLKTPDGVIIWAPGIRHSNFAAVVSTTRNIVRFSSRVEV